MPSLPYNGNRIRDAIEFRTRAEGIDLRKNYFHYLDANHPRGIAHYFVNQQTWRLYGGAYVRSPQIFAMASFVVLDDGEILKSRSSSIVIGENVIRGAQSVKLLPLSKGLRGDEKISALEEQHLCHCEMRSLMMYGCRCGGK